MVKVEQEHALPDAEERRRILERAGAVLAQARTLVQNLDAIDRGSMALVSLEPPGFLRVSFRVVYPSAGMIVHGPSVTQESRARLR